MSVRAGQPAKPVRRKAPSPQNSIGFLFFLGAVSVGFAALMINIAMTKPGRVATAREEPEVLVVDGHVGVSSKLVNGEYRLLPRQTNNHAVWAKYVGIGRVPTMYMLYSACGEWLVSSHHDGQGSKCDGFVVARGCGDDDQGAVSGPWNCTGQWQSAARAGRAAEFMAVTTAKGPPALSPCSPQEEAAAAEEVAELDIVITWVNGSDPHWLQDREKACRDFMWQQHWPSALDKSERAKECLKEAESVEEAKAFRANGSCAEGARGRREGACAEAAGEAAGKEDVGLTTQDSRCFRKFLEQQCASRLPSIADHDELRYLIRSLERQMPWHKGRILLVTPRHQFPRWLHSRGRLRVLAQEDLFRLAMQSPEFVSAKRRGEPSYLPDSIFNDDPIHYALPFIPKVSRLVMVLQDDLFLPRPVGACELFTRPPVGLRLFGEPAAITPADDVYASVYRTHQVHTQRFWEDFVKADTSAKRRGRGRISDELSPYYDPQHVPSVMDTSILRDFWRRWPREMSAGMDSPFRHPALLNVLGLHNAEALRRARAARVGADWKISWTERIRTQLAVAAFKIRKRYVNNSTGHHSDWKDLPARSRAMDLRDPGQLLAREVVMNQGTEAEWRKLMGDILSGRVVPAVLSIQDNLGSQASQEYICLREKWLNRLLAGPSTWESTKRPPSLCSAAASDAAPKP